MAGAIVASTPILERLVRRSEPRLFSVGFEIRMETRSPARVIVLMPTAKNSMVRSISAAEKKTLFLRAVVPECASVVTLTTSFSGMARKARGSAARSEGSVKGISSSGAEGSIILA